MSRQFSFYLTPNDLLALERKVRKAAIICVFGDESGEPKPLELPTIGIDKMGKDNLAVYITRPDFRDQICLDKIDNLKIWAIDILFSPVIEFSRCYFDGKILRLGRMYYTTGYYKDDESWTNKDFEFLEWARRIFSVTKRSLDRNKELDAYFGEEAKKLYEAGKVKLLNP